MMTKRFKRLTVSGSKILMVVYLFRFCVFFSSRRRHTRWNCDWIQTCALPIYPSFRAILPPGTYVTRPRNFLTHTDNALNGYPRLHYVQTTLSAGEIPWWNPYLAMGLPGVGTRSEERRVGKECRARRWRHRNTK